MSGVQQLLEAGPVQQVAAVRDVARDARRVDVLQAHGAVRPGHVLHALDTTTIKNAGYFWVMNDEKLN